VANKPEIFNIPSLETLVCLESERAYPTLVGHRSDMLKSIAGIYLKTDNIFILSYN
jgi:hypothetical protein